MVCEDDSGIGIDAAAQFFKALRQEKHHRVIVVFAAKPAAVEHITERIDSDDIGRRI